MLKSENYTWEISAVRGKFLQLNCRDIRGRSRFVESPDAPLEEFREFKGRIGSCKLLFMAPCSYLSYEEAKKYFEHVIIVDHSAERLELFHRNYEGMWPLEHILINSDEHWREILANYDEELSSGMVNSYMPKRFQNLDEKLYSLLAGKLLDIQKEFCSFAANRSLKRWHSTVNRLLNFKNVTERLTSLPFIDGADVVIVGAGPSLDYTVETLKEYQNKAFIIASDGSLKTLIEAGVIPDFLVSSEDTVTSWRFVAGIEFFLKNVPLVLDFKSNHQLAALYPGPVILTSEASKDLWYQKLAAKFPVLELGRCVGHMAFNLAVALGAGRIIMTGFDLAFRQGRFHPAAMPYPYFHDSEPNELVTVEGRDGEILNTDISMLFYLRDFEWLISQAKQIVIDATEGGALKKGARVLSLETALVDNEALNKKIQLSFVDASFRGYLDELYKDVEIGPLSKEGINLVDSCCSHLVQNSLLASDAERRADFEEGISLICSLSDDFNKKEARSIFIRRGQVPLQIESWLMEHSIEIVEEKSLPEMLHMVKEKELAKIYCCNAQVTPDLFTIPGIECVDLKSTDEPCIYEKSLWVPGYEVRCLENVYDFWKEYVPADVRLGCLELEQYSE